MRDMRVTRAKEDLLFAQLQPRKQNRGFREKGRELSLAVTALTHQHCNELAMRIIYGVHGYNRGHASRSAAVLPQLQERHDLLVLAGGEAYDALAGDFRTEHVDSFGYSYGKTRISKLGTVVKNVPKLIDLFTIGRNMRRIIKLMRTFRPDVVISDAEAYTHRAAQYLSIPRVGFDHYGMLAHFRIPLRGYNRIKGFAARLVYLGLMGKPQRVLVSSFFPAQPREPDMQLVGPMLRPEVHRHAAVQGSHILAYLNKANYQMTPSVEQALQDLDVEVRLYGTGVDEKRGNIRLRPYSTSGFLSDLASCQAVIATAGNQLPGEALAYGKPLLVVPEGSVEQYMNATAVERLGVGEMLESFKQLSSRVIRDFLHKAPEYAETARRVSSDGCKESIRILERWISELSGGRQQTRGIGARVPST